MLEDLVYAMGAFGDTADDAADFLLSPLSPMRPISAMSAFGDADDADSLDELIESSHSKLSLPIHVKVDDFVLDDLTEQISAACCAANVGVLVLSDDLTEQNV